MPDDFLIDAFRDAISEKLDAERFERLMLGVEEKGIERCWDSLALIDLSPRVRDRSALAELEASLALERLQGRYPEIWEQVVMGEAVDA